MDKVITRRVVNRVLLVYFFFLFFFFLYCEYFLFEYVGVGVRI